MGRQLANLLDEAIESLATEQNPRGDVIAAMASAAGISESTVGQILDASIECPPLERLQGFAEVLDLSLDRILEAFEGDGCALSEPEEEELEGDRSVGGLTYRGSPLRVSDHALRADSGGGECLEMEFAFASAHPVERDFGSEVLDMRGMRVDRVSQGVVPVLADHDSRAVIGRVLEVRVVGGVARARVRFSRSQAARDVVQDILDGIRTGVSFGYRIHRQERASDHEDHERFIVRDFEVFELTITSIPADPTVGVHRSAVTTPRAAARGRGRHRSREMTLSLNHLQALDESSRLERMAGWSSAKRANALEELRKLDIEMVGRNFRATPEHTKRAIERGLDVEGFVRELREIRSRGSEPVGPPPMGLDAERSLASRDPVFGLDAADVGQWSLSRAIEALVSGRPEQAPFEFQLSDHCRSADPRREYRGRGLTVPLQVFQRAIGKASPNSSGAALVGTEHLSGSFVDVLRPFLATSQLGVTVIPSSGADLSIPRQVTAAQTGWIDENAGSGESSPTFDSILLTPHTVRVRTDLTRRMVKQADPSVDLLVQRDILAAIGQAVDAAVFSGSGSGAEPEGILAASGVGSVTYDTASGAAERASLVEMTDDVASANVAMTAPAFVFRSSVRARFMTLAIDPGSGRFLFEEGQGQNEGRVIGIRAITANTLPANLGVGLNETPIIFGNWSDVILATWSTIDLMVDEVTLGDSGGLVLRGFQDVDVALRHPESFSVAQLDPAA